MPASTAKIAPVPPESTRTLVSLAADDPRWKQVEDLPCCLSVEVRVPAFTLRDLLNLGPKSIVRSQLGGSTSPGLRVNSVLVAWCDFEVLGSRLAVRLTELA